MNKLEPVYFDNPVTPDQSERFRTCLAQRFPGERARIQGLVDDAIASIQGCDPKLLLAIASYALLVYKITKSADSESLKLRAVEFIQNVLVSHKVNTVECSEEDMQERCVQTIGKVERVEEEMLQFALYYDLILQKVVPDDKERDFLLNIQMMYNVRGKRDVYFHDRYFRLLLSSQDSNLQRCYGVSAEQVIDGILKLTHVLFESRAEKFLELNMRIRDKVKSLKPDDMMCFMESSQECAWNVIKDISDFDVESVTGWPKQLMLDLSLPIASEDQQVTRDYQFWPIDDLCIRDKPFIILGTRAYCFDYYTFVDNIYHALFTLCRDKEFRHERRWSRSQAKAIEEGVANIFSNLLPGAKVLENVRYTPTGKNGDARELDVVIICAGVTLVIEAKAIEYIHEPPILRPDKVLSFYRNSAKKAGEQTRKFLDYVADSRTRTIRFMDEAGNVVCKMDKGELGRVFRMGVIADSTNEVLACTKKLQEIDADADGFVCLSLDDLLVYEKYFEHEPMQFLAYLSARADASNLKQTMNSDELDHLGLYICNPHYVQEIKRLHDGNIHMFLEDNRRNLDDFFNSLRNPSTIKPTLYLPDELTSLLHAVWRHSIKNKVKIASLITGLTREEKDWLVKALAKELDEQRYYARSSTRNCSSEISDIGVGLGLLIRTQWASPVPREVWQMRTQAMMKKFNESKRNILVLDYDPTGAVIDAAIETITPADFDASLDVEAEAFTREIDRRVVEKAKRMGKIGRNDKCPCGSGLKYKNCCGRER